MIAAWRDEESIVVICLEEFFHAVEVESERQENFHIRSFDEHTFVGFLGIFQVAHAYGIVALAIAHRV